MGLLFWKKDKLGAPPKQPSDSYLGMGAPLPPPSPSPDALSPPFPPLGQPQESSFDFTSEIPMPPPMPEKNLQNAKESNEIPAPPSELFPTANNSQMAGPIQDLPAFQEDQKAVEDSKMQQPQVQALVPNPNAAQAQPQKDKPAGAKQDEAAFELPDFIDDEMPGWDEDTKRKDKELIKAPTPAVSFQKSAYPDPHKKVEMPDIKFVGLRKSFRVKEGISELKILVRNIEDKVEEHHTSPKNEKYNALSTILNMVQDKLIVVDNKLFEQADSFEVKP